MTSAFTFMVAEQVSTTHVIYRNGSKYRRVDQPDPYKGNPSDWVLVSGDHYGYLYCKNNE